MGEYLYTWDQYRLTVYTYGYTNKESEAIEWSRERTEREVIRVINNHIEGYDIPLWGPYDEFTELGFPDLPVPGLPAGEGISGTSPPWTIPNYPTTDWIEEWYALHYVYPPEPPQINFDSGAYVPYSARQIYRHYVIDMDDYWWRRYKVLNIYRIDRFTVKYVESADYVGSLFPVAPMMMMFLLLLGTLGGGGASGSFRKRRQSHE